MRKLYWLLLTDTALIICIIYALSYNQKDSGDTQFSRLVYFVPKDEPASANEIMHFNGPDLLKQIAHKKFVPVSLTGDMVEDEKRFEFIRWKSRELKYTYDTTQILKVHLPDNITYGQFVRLLDVMRKDQHKRFFEFRNNFYIFGDYPSSEVESIEL